MDLKVTEMGAGETLIVFLHGVLDRGRSFESVATLLESAYRMLWYDRRGYGSSLFGEPVDVDGNVADLLGILDGRRAVLVGHSFGGMTALGAAMQAPEMVDAVVLYETVIPWAPAWNDAVMQEVLNGEDPETAGLRLMFGDRCEGFGKEKQDGLRREAKAFVVEEGAVRTGTPPFDVAELRPPLVYGRGETPNMGSLAEYLTGRVALMEEVIIPGGGHHAHRRAPEAFAALVRRGIELARLPVRSTPAGPKVSDD